jgi:hypothetical protein
MGLPPNETSTRATGLIRLGVGASQDFDGGLLSYHPTRHRYTTLRDIILPPYETLNVNASVGIKGLASPPN